MLKLPLALARSLADLIAPPRCAACDALHPDGALCTLCAEGLLPAEETPEGVRAAFLHGGPIAAAIHRAKYGDDPSVAWSLGALLRRVEAPAGCVLLPMPLHRRRLVARGFNQSAALAAGAWGRARLSTGLLERTRDTPTQTALHRDARRENVRGAFRVTDASRLRGREVVLIDDVVTTGATLGEAMACVRDAGAKEVRAVTLAAAALRHPRTGGV